MNGVVRMYGDFSLDTFVSVVSFVVNVQQDRT